MPPSPAAAPANMADTIDREDGKQENVFRQPILRAQDIWSETQRKVLASIGDAVVPTLEGEAASVMISQLPVTATERQRELVARFATEGFATRSDYLLDCIARQFGMTLSPKSRNDIATLLTVIGTGPGCFALSGVWGPFQDLTREKREAIIASWAASSLPLFRKAASGLKSLILLSYYRFVPEAWEATGYPAGLPNDWSSLPDQKVCEHYPYKFVNDELPFLTTPEEIFVDTEVLIVGSGSGGGVAAASLARRGVQVLVVDKGIYLRPEQMTGQESHGYRTMYDGEGAVATEDAHLTVLAGSTFGGGSTINWSASLKPRNFVRNAWANKHGVKYYATPAFTADLNYVCARMGASTEHIKHNLGNSLLALGSQRAGMECVPVPQNTGGNVHYCGKCQLGCPSGQKQGGVITWLRDAAEAGAKFMTSCHVQRILFDKSGRKAIGAKALVDGRPVTIRASKAVICSGGSINTPALLLRTPQLKFNKQIGKNLHLHPTTTVTGYYDFPINPWEGSLLTMVNNATELVDKEGWGCKLEVIATSPGIHAAFCGYENGADHKAKMLRYSHSFQIIIITRDRDGGEVTIDENGDARLHHPLTKHEQASMIRGILAAADVHMSAGAREVATVQTGVKSFVSDVGGDTIPGAVLNEPLIEETNRIPGTTYHEKAIPRDLLNPAYIKWKQGVEKAGTRPLTLSVGSAHQMSSCRMGANPKQYACDPEGRVWGTKDLWVADASALPEASGVNPMITTMATANYVARNVARQLGVDGHFPISEATQREARL